MRERAHVQEWLRSVPGSWEVPLLKLVARVESGHTPSRSKPEYWVAEECLIPWFSLADIWQLREGKKKFLGDTAECVSALGIDNSGARVLPAGTVVLSRTASVGFSGIMPRPMATTQDFVNFVVGPRLTPDFLLWVLRGMKPEFERLRRGSTHKTIYMPDALQFRVPLPPLLAQKAIADFLDRKTAAIDALIEKKQRLLGLLAEKRAALINEAVTKGLDPSVPMKDSGIPWIGQIPAHWEAKRLKFVVGAIVDCKNRTPEYHDDGEYGVVRTSNIRGGEFVREALLMTDEANFRIWTQRGRPQPDDIMFTREAPAGEACFVPDAPVVCLGQRTMLFRCETRIQASYILHSIYGGAVIGYVQSVSAGSTVSHLRLEQVGDLPICLPDPSEQRTIVAHLKSRLARGRAREAALLSSIERLQEYRQALITAAVTGQLDVNEEAA